MSISPSILRTATPPWTITYAGSSTELRQLADVERDQGAFVHLDGSKMTSEAALFSEMQIQFKLPDYFGQNWDALDECLADLEWLPATFYVIAIDHAEQILESEKERTRQILSRLVKRIPEEWSHPVVDGEDWDRPAVPFHWVLCEQAQSDDRLGVFSLDPEAI